MLSENPTKRPDIYRVMKEVCSMRGKEVPVKDIYSQRTQSEARSNQRLPSPARNVATPPPVAAVQEVPAPKEQQIPDITPMRRGRPPTTQRTPAPVSKMTAAPVKQDPFAALDATDIKVRTAAVEKLASKFPAVDDLTTPPRSNTPATKASMDKAFESLAQPEKATRLSTSKSAPAIAPQKPLKKFVPPSKPLPKPEALTSSSPKPQMPEIRKPPPVSNRPIWKVPEPSSDRPSFSADGKPETLVSRTAAKYNSNTASLSSRPSLEGMRAEAFEQGSEIERSKSADIRPSATETESAFPQDQEDQQQDDNEMSTVDYLRESEKEKHHLHLPHRSHHDHHLSLRRSKHASMPASASAGSRSLATGKLGAAFRRFEAGETEEEGMDDGVPALSPMVDLGSEDPIKFQETAVEEVEDELSPETRREMERRHALAEERRVADAAAAYRLDRSKNDGISRGGVGSVRKVSAIQDRVNNFLNESGRRQPVRRTASGYGKYTTMNEDERERTLDEREVNIPAPSRQQASRGANESAPVKATQPSKEPSTMMSGAIDSPAPQEAMATTTKTAPLRTGAARPSAPPKKAHLRTATGSSIPPPRLPVSASAPAPLIDEDLIEFSVVPDADDPEADFAKRYPDLERIETELVGPRANRPLRMRDV